MKKCRLRARAGRWTAILLFSTMLFTGAFAEEGPAVAPMLKAWTAEAAAGEAQEITLSATLHKLLPYGEDTVVALNRLLSECKLNVHYREDGQTSTASTSLMIGETPAFDMAERTEGEQFLSQTSLLPGMTLESKEGSPLSALLGQAWEPPMALGDTLNLAGLGDSLPDVLGGLAGFAQDKKVSYKIASVGTAKDAVVYTVPQESAALLGEALSLLAKKLPWPQAAEKLKTLSLDGAATVTLYKDAGGAAMGLAVKGNMALEGIAFRKVDFLWGFSVKAKEAVHTVSLKSPAAKGSDALTVSGKLSVTSGESQNRLTLSLDIRNTLEKKLTKTRWEGALNGLLADDNQRLEGEIKRTVTGPDNVAHTLSIKPGLMVYLVGEELSLKGNVRIAWGRNKSTLTDVTISLLAEKAQSPVWEETEKTVSVDGIGESDKSVLAQAARNAVAKAVWQAMLSLPEECLTLVSQSISQQDWQKIYGTISR